MQSIVDQNERMNDFPHTHTYMYSRIYRNKIPIYIIICVHVCGMSRKTTKGY